MKTITILLLALMTLNSFCQSEVYFDLSINQTVLKSNAIDTTLYTIDSIRTDTLFYTDSIVNVRATVPIFRHFVPTTYSKYYVRFTAEYKAGGFAWYIDTNLVQLHGSLHSGSLSQNGPLRDTLKLDSSSEIKYQITGVQSSGRYEVTSEIYHVVDTFFVNSVITSIEEVQKEALKVYPNPTKDYLNIEGYFGKEFELVDLKGTVLKTEKVTSKIELIEVPKGIYFLKVENVVLKFIKN